MGRTQTPTGTATPFTTISFCGTITATPTNFNLDETVPTFDLSLGTLTNVSVSILGTIVQTFKVENTDTAATMVTATGGGSVALTLPNLALLVALALSTGCSRTAVLATRSCATRGIE